MLKRFWPIGLALTVLAGDLAIAGEVEVDGSIRIRKTAMKNHDFDGDSDDANNFASMRTRIGMSTAVGEFGSAFVQLQDARVLGEPVSTTTSLEQVDLHQAYILISNVFNSSLEFQIGRMEMAYGSHRQIGNADWNDNGRAFDGFLAMLDMEDTGWIHFFAMKTKETGGILSGVNDGANVTQTGPGSGPTGESAFLGAYAHFDLNPQTVVEGYLLDNYTDTGDLTTDTGAVIDAIGQRITAGGRARWQTDEDADTAIKISAEGAVQFGTTPEVLNGQNEAVDNDIAAVALAAQAAVGLPSALPFYLILGYDMASGDSDATDDEVGTYQQVFPTTHGVLGHIDLVGWQNIQDISVTAKLIPNDRWKLWGSFHMFSVVEAADAWYGVDGMARQTGDAAFDTGLANEIDLGAKFSPEENLSFVASVALWLPGSWQEQSTALAEFTANPPTDAGELAEFNADPGAFAAANATSLDSALSAYLYTILSF